MLEKENEDFKEEVFEQHNEISRLENALQRSEKEKYFLDKQVQRMRSKMEADEQTLHKLIEIQEQMKAELENERSLVKTLFSALQVEEKEVIMTNLPMQSETEMVMLEEKRELEKQHLTKQKYLTKKKKELSDKITYVIPEQQATERTPTVETEKLKKNKGQERQTTET